MFNSIKTEYLKSTFEIRFFEEKIAEIYSTQVIRCPVHLAIGHEAVAVGVCLNLKKSDSVFSYHRSHHHYLAKGGDPQKLLWELLGDSRGCSAGRGGSTHLTDLDAGFIASTAIISGTFPVASGYAHSLKLKKSDNICVLFCGDAAIEEGVFFETLNMAALWNLPLLVVMEDNDLSCYTNKKTRQALKNYSDIASLFSIGYESVDGCSAEQVFSAAENAVNFVRKNSKPFLLHTNVYRALEHCGPEQDDLLAYRNIEGNWPDKDPLHLMKSLFSENEYEQIKKSAYNKISGLFDVTLRAAK